MIELRDYQEELLKKIDGYLSKKKGNPCAVAPTGSGKGFIIGAFIERKLQKEPDAGILMVTHSKELIIQDKEKLLSLWPDAPIGIYSASIGKKIIDKPVTMAGIQSIIRVPEIPAYSYILVDEAHMINNEDIGSYRKLFRLVREKNPAMRVIGFTATPFRLGQGLITEGNAIFDDLLQSVTTLDLQKKGYLAWLSTKQTEKEYDTEGITIRGGEFVEKELQERVMSFDGNAAVCDEIVRSAERFGKKHILVFCTGIEHASAIRDMLNERGLRTECITGEMDKAEREELIAGFKSGEIRALTNINVLSIGFDFADIDMLAMLRPTCSMALWQQQCGRGLRVKSDGSKCLVLDFAGNTKRLGPINMIKASMVKKKGKGRKRKDDGKPLVKTCPVCNEIYPIQMRKCPSCGYTKTPAELFYELSGIDVNGRDDAGYIFIGSWYWHATEEKKSGRPMLMCFYRPYFDRDEEISVLYCVNSPYQKLKDKARAELRKAILSAELHSGRPAPIDDPGDTKALAHRLNQLPAPFAVIWSKEPSATGSGFYHIDRFVYPDDSVIFSNLKQTRTELEAIEKKKQPYRRNRDWIAKSSYSGSMLH